MGCCCPKEKSVQDDVEEIDERTRLLSSEQKSRFINPGGQTSSQLNQNTNMISNTSGYINPLSSSDIGNYDYQLMLNQQNSNLNQPSNNQSQNFLSESNQMFEKILSEVIHVTAFDQRTTSGIGGGGYQSNDIMQFSSAEINLNLNQVYPVQEMPFKLKGLLEPQTLNKQQQLSLPEGVPAPFSVLAAQPPFTNDIRLINSFAHEAFNCINNFSLNVPDNVAFDFKPVVL